MTAIPPAAFVVMFPRAVVVVEDVTVRDDKGALPPTALLNITDPIPAVTDKLRGLLSESTVELNRISPDVAPLETERFAVSTTAFSMSI